MRYAAISPSSYSFEDFDAVAGRELAPPVLGAGQHLAVDCDGELSPLEPEELDQLRDGSSHRQRARLTVHADLDAGRLGGLAHDPSRGVDPVGPTTDRR
jgi:hypothetical protein